MTKKSVLLVTIMLFVIVSIISAIKINRINYVYVPGISGPTGACTSILLDYTYINNGNPPILRTASSISITFGCHIVSIYPDNVNGN